MDSDLFYFHSLQKEKKKKRIKFCDKLHLVTYHEIPNRGGSGGSVKRATHIY